MLQSRKSLRLYCFSPPVMLATFTIEVLFACYVIWRYKMNVITRLVTAILLFLATFQGVEFLLCGGLGLAGGTWSQVGYVAITTLPPLGIHLAHAIAGRGLSRLTMVAYTTGLAFILYFAFATQAISGHTCYANYVTFDTHEASSLLYALYYYGWLAVGIWLTWKWAPSLKKNRRAALYSLMAGYLAFIVPTTAINIINPDTVAGIPSIMCGFAVILAAVLVTKVSPNSLPLKESGRLKAKV